MRMRSVFKHSAQALLEGALIATLVVVLIAGTAFAGGKSARGGGTGASVWFEPVTTTVGSTYVIAGSGFRANTFVSVGARYADTTWWPSGPTDSTGSFRFTATARTPGEIVHDVYEKARNGYRLKLSVILHVDN